MEDVIERIKGLARDSWGGKVGEDRATEVESYLRKKLREYADFTGARQKDILDKWESDRNISVMNYYQEANQPSLTSHHEERNTRVFESLDELYEKVGKGGFRCPSCDGVSSDPYKCNANADECDWKVYGLFGDLGKGVYVYVKDELRGQSIFMPTAWEEEK